MIVTNSKNIATDEADVDKMGVFAMPLTTTGKKKSATLSAIMTQVFM